MAKAPEFPNPVKMRGRLFWRRSELETYKHQLLTFASGVPASAGFVANQIESFVPAGEVALEFGFGRRTLGRRIAGRNIPEVAYRMTSDVKNPASLAASRAPKYDCLAADRASEITENAHLDQAWHQAYIARRCKISRHLAVVVAGLALDGGAQ